MSKPSSQQAGDTRPYIDLRLSKLRLDKTPESSHTEESLLLGYFENVLFVEWEAFDTILDDVLFNEIAKVNEDVRQEATSRIKSANKQINEVFFRIKSKTIGLDGTEDSTCNVGASRLEKRERSTRSPPTSHHSNTASVDNIDSSAFSRALDLRKKYSTCTSVENVHSDVFMAVRELIREIHLDTLCLDIDVKSFPVVGPPDTGPKRNPLADRCLVRYDDNSLMYPPLCAFELKGPKLDLSTPAIAVNEANKKSNKTRKTCATNDAPSVGKKKHIVSRTSRLENSDVGQAGSTPRLTPPMLRHCAHEISAEEMCVYFNYLFGDLKHFYTYRGRIPNATKQIMNPIAQTLTQALTMSSVCSFLYTREVGIAFEIAKRNEKDDRLVIRTSRLFCCENELGTTAAMLALAHYSVKKTLKDGGDNSKTADFANKIRSAVRQRKNNTSGRTARGEGAITEAPARGDQHIESRKPAPSSSGAELRQASEIAARQGDGERTFSFSHFIDIRRRELLGCTVDEE